MLSEQWLRGRPEQARAALRRRSNADEMLVNYEAWRALDAERRAIATRFDALSAEARAKANGGRQEQQTASRDDMRELRRQLTALTEHMRALALTLPNAPDLRTPDGADASGNRVVRTWGEPRRFDGSPQTHEALGARLGILDLPRATRMSGPRFPLLIGDGALVARALVAFLLDAHRREGYVEVSPPDLLLASALTGTGHLPKFADDLFVLPRDDLYLSPTAEAQLMALHASETLDGRDLPLAYTAFTQAYRREAGSAGARTHGLLRQRQFGKVELARIVEPEKADAALESMLATVEAALQRLGLPYRVVELCAGELPFSARRTFDVEVWLAGEGRYIEISSVSDCGDFQSRRLNLRYRPQPRANSRHPYTLNGSALPIGRTLAALLEAGQQPGGAAVRLPRDLALFGAPEMLVARG